MHQTCLDECCGEVAGELLSSDDSSRRTISEEVTLNSLPDPPGSGLNWFAKTPVSSSEKFLDLHCSCEQLFRNNILS